jgi:transposase
MGVQELLDKSFPTHGNWQGLSLGNVATVWLTHILSQADHCLNHVQLWAEHRLESLGILLGQDVRGLDMSDDRLESLLRYLSLDPLGLPIATEIVEGNRADDPLYKPAIQRVRETLGVGGLLYVGDCKMGGLSTRYFIQSEGDYYLCPLSKKQVGSEELRKYVEHIKEAGIKLKKVSYDYADNKTVIIAKGYKRMYSCTVKQGEEEITWEERKLVVYSIAHGESEKESLRNRLKKLSKNWDF